MKKLLLPKYQKRMEKKPNWRDEKCTVGVYGKKLQKTDVEDLSPIQTDRVFKEEKEYTLKKSRALNYEELGQFCNVTRKFNLV